MPSTPNAHPAANQTTISPAAALAADRRARIALIALLAGALGIALSPIFVRLSEIGPVATAFWRIGFAMPVLLVWLALEGRGTDAPRRPSTRRDYLRLTWAGLFFAGDLAVWHWSIQFTSVANSTLLANFAPIFVTLVAWAVFKERFSRVFVGGLALAIGGAVVLMGESLSFSASHLFGDALGVVTAMFYAGYILSVGRLRAEFSTATIMTWTGVVTGVTLLPITLLSGESLIAPTLHGWIILAGLGVISHAGGQSLIAYALAHLPPAFSSVSLLLQPAAAGVFAWMLLDEPLSLLQALGAAIVLAGIFMARRGSR
ncbi:membrane protein [Skermanella stibiiresistens SB22]|uniref:Membrane protein n=1 Tax=Skermanella stibiiresistens SB22 TaxID=1385369 RepID=W9H140_9PROT|nr:DMT family transporter [Skermanella stibiiresistens]EWY37468.1 membrane protein [Skermanella stibiiresistens SB22]